MSQCRNCERTFDGEYCPACGQRDVDLERPISDLLRELVAETFEIDGRAYRTLRTMVLQPGVLTSEFLAGRRKSFTSPLRLYLVISVVFFVVAAWLAEQGVLLDPGQSVDLDAAGQARFMSDRLPKLMFVLLPIFALLFKIAFRQRLYFDHVIFAIHIHSVSYIVFVLMLPMENIPHLLAVLTQVALLGYLLSYFVLAVHQVYASGWFAATAKSLAVLFMYLALISGVVEATSSMQILSD